MSGVSTTSLSFGSVRDREDRLAKNKLLKKHTALFKEINGDAWLRKPISYRGGMRGMGESMRKYNYGLVSTQASLTTINNKLTLDYVVSEQNYNPCTDISNSAAVGRFVLQGDKLLYFQTPEIIQKDKFDGTKTVKRPRYSEKALVGTAIEAANLAEKFVAKGIKPMLKQQNATYVDNQLETASKLGQLYLTCDKAHEPKVSKMISSHFLAIRDKNDAKSKEIKKLYLSLCIEKINDLVGVKLRAKTVESAKLIKAAVTSKVVSASPQKELHDLTTEYTVREKAVQVLHKIFKNRSKTISEADYNTLNASVEVSKELSKLAFASKFNPTTRDVSKATADLEALLIKLEEKQVGTLVSLLKKFKSAKAHKETLSEILKPIAAKYGFEANALLDISKDSDDLTTAEISGTKSSVQTYANKYVKSSKNKLYISRLVSDKIQDASGFHKRQLIRLLVELKKQPLKSFANLTINTSKKRVDAKLKAEIAKAFDEDADLQSRMKTCLNSLRD